ncbi:MAG: hypothetical protein AB1546_04705 [bacterium]
MEQAINSILLGLHNLALVVCVGGPYYMSRIVRARARYEKKIIYTMDKLEEDVITTQPAICMLAIFVLYATGIGMPLVHLLIHGRLKEMTTIAMAAFWMKQLLVLGMVAIQFYGAFYINPKIKEIFARFREGETPNPKDEKEFFTIRAIRRKWCDRCLVLGILVLIISPFIRWF